ncbi:Bzip transcription factor [Phytophthora megakarya]|uniref:Bzip transcription factor n=1 Tax=Phytophthora megakarya TaxID=4795 RepID=A0A225X053_9STRA|nr:Bzip transcription factor [Phytophthora megakarya]
MMTSRRNFDRNPAPFSDAVIGSALTRVVAPGYRFSKSASNNTNPNATSLQQPMYYMPTPTVTLPPLRSLSPLAASATSAAEPTENFQLRSMPRRLQGETFPTVLATSFALHSSGQTAVPYPASSVGFRPADSPARSVSAAVATLSINHNENATPKQKRKRRVSVKTEACREQCRTNQARYRQKQREYVAKLESTVGQLREEIPMLEVQRRRLRYDSQQRVWDVVVEYFQLFHHGVGDAFDQGSAHSSDVLRASEAQQQLMFLRSTMAPDVEFGNVSGVEVLMEQWRRLSAYHEDLNFQLTHMEKVSESIVTATATLSVTITKTTLECVFPHLMGSENVEDLSLAVKLLGHKLDYPCSVLFVWDEETSLVVRVETDIDMATPLLGLLGNLKDVSRVLQGAVMAPNNYIDEDA